jgi:phosphomevalonate kinase
MKVIAPGKLVLTGAYAVLDGAPAIVAAVDRHALADSTAPSEVDTRSLHDEQGQKLGLGSSSASLVASLGACAAARGDDLRDPRVRAGLFRAARTDHARSQGGGSGADVAAAVHGGVLRYTVAGRDGHEAVVRKTSLPQGLVWVAFWSGRSARTSDLVARVRSPRMLDAHPARRLRPLAARAADCVDAGDCGGFVAAARDYGRALDALGRAADAPIVPPAFAELAELAAGEDAAFLPSGAGGGDIAVWLSSAAPSRAFSTRAAALSMVALDLRLDPDGVRNASAVDDGTPRFGSTAVEH